MDFAISTLQKNLGLTVGHPGVFSSLVLAGVSVGGTSLRGGASFFDSETGAGQSGCNRRFFRFVHRRAIVDPSIEGCTHVDIQV